MRLATLFYTQTTQLKINGTQNATSRSTCANAAILALLSSTSSGCTGYSESTKATTTISPSRSRPNGPSKRLGKSRMPRTLDHQCRIHWAWPGTSWMPGSSYKTKLLSATRITSRRCNRSKRRSCLRSFSFTSFCPRLSFRLWPVTFRTSMQASQFKRLICASALISPPCRIAWRMAPSLPTCFLKTISTNCFQWSTCPQPKSGCLSSSTDLLPWSGKFATSKMTHS